jgi:hypothetical protein
MSPFYRVAELLRSDAALRGTDIDFPNAYTAQRDLLLSGGAKPQAEGFQYTVSQPTVFKGSVGLEQQLTGNAQVDATYSFARGLHLLRGDILLNTSPMQSVGRQDFIMVTQPLPNPYWNRMRWRLTDGSSWYHAFLLNVRMIRSSRFEAHVAYTFSKSLDDGSDWNVPSDYGAGDQAGLRSAKWWGPSAFDIRNSVSSDFVLRLGGGSLTGIQAKLLSGWSLSGLLHLDGGYPLTPTSTRPRAGSAVVQYVNGSSLDLAPGANANPISPQNPDHYFDASEFLYPVHGVRQAGNHFNPALSNLNGLGPAIAVGNLGRNTMTAPGSATLDLALHRRVPLRRMGESTAIEFRAEGFNVLNRPNFDSPALNLFTAQGQPVTGAGVISGTRGSSREIQLALRLEF